MSATPFRFHPIWKTADELSFINQVVGVTKPNGSRETLKRYARALSLRSNWQGIDAQAIRTRLFELGVEWQPPAAALKVRG